MKVWLEIKDKRTEAMMYVPVTGEDAKHFLHLRAHNKMKTVMTEEDLVNKITTEKNIFWSIYDRTDLMERTYKLRWKI